MTAGAYAVHGDVTSLYKQGVSMTYAIIGFGRIGHALAKAFARKGIDVSVATTRDPKTFAEDAAAIGPQVFARTQALPDWQGKIIIDVTNAYGEPAEKLIGRSSAAVVAQAFTGGKVVKGFNHLGAPVLGQDPAVHGGKRVVFLASDDDSAATEVAVLAEKLGFAPIKLGALAEGGLLVQGGSNTWGHLIFKDLVKFN
jgi:predicted dinucleotide-binding enzyme